MWPLGDNIKTDLKYSVGVNLIQLDQNNARGHAFVNIVMIL
jgi:hypothetical protein